MATVSFTHELYEIDAAVDAVTSLAQRFGVTAILPCTQEQYDAITPKNAGTIYVVYTDTKFSMYYGTLPLSGGGGGISAGAFFALLVGGAGSAGRLTEPEAL